MAPITKFEDILAWQAAKRLLEAFDVATGDSRTFRNRRLHGQMEDCADSIMSNIVEGYDSGSDPEFVRFLKIAYRSASEFQSHLYVAKHRRFVTPATFDALYGLARETKAYIRGFIRYLKECINGKRRPGDK